MLVTDIWGAFQKGKQLANSATWKNCAVLTNTLVAFIGSAVAIAVAFGYDIQISREDIQALSSGIAVAIAVGNSVVHVVTTTKIGLPSNDSNPA